MEIIISREYEYIPTFRDNRESSDKVTCTLQALTPSQRDQSISISYDADGKPGIHTDLSKIVRWGAKEIKGLSVNGIPIKTGVDVANTPGLEDLFSELANEIIQRNERTDLKNS